MWRACSCAKEGLCIRGFLYGGCFCEGGLYEEVACCEGVCVGRVV